MNKTQIRILLFVLLGAFAAMLAGCKSESSPTAPSTTTTPPTTTNPGTPPSGASVTLSFSNNAPTAPADVIVTATVTLNGQPVPNGTAVQFTTNIGQFKESASQSVIRTTTNGIATITLTSSSAGSGTVTATVNDVQKSLPITFASQPPPPPPGQSTTPTITNITPNTGLPQGGTVITITGTNFRTPVRVIVDPGNGQPTKDAFVNQVTPTQITAVMPPFDITTGQTLAVSITVVDEAGTPSETPVTKANAFTYQAAVLTPSIRTIEPTSGPIDGGTRVSIFGDAFQAPVQVFFGSAEAQVLHVTFNEVDVVAPTARDTNPNASGAVTGPIDVKVRNVASGTSATSPQQFRYVAHVQITAVGPGIGTAFGGTRVTIDGTGFNAPVTVSFAGIVATPISVSATQIVALTGRTPIPCSPPSGATVVTNVDNGDGASGAAFAYLPEKPLIISVTDNSGVPTNSAVPGQSLHITVIKPGVGVDGTAIIRFQFTIGGQVFTVFPTPTTITDPFGPTTFTVVVPTPPPSVFPSVACTTGGGLAGTQPGPATTTITFQNITTTCTDTLNGFQVAPTTSTCTATAPPPAISLNPSTLCPNGLGTVASGSTGTQQIVVSNMASGTGAQSLTVSNITVSGPDASQFSVAPTSVTVAPGQAAPVTVTFSPTSSGVKNATLTFFTNDPANPTKTVCLQGTAP